MQLRLQTIQNKLRAACIQAGRDPETVRLLPVSKTFPHSDVQKAIDLGLTRFGENRAQDLRARAEYFKNRTVETSPVESGPRPNSLQWVMIGHVQTNKAKEIARYADELQSLDRWSLAEALHRRLQIEQRVLPVYIQIKTAREETKFGLDPEELLGFLTQLEGLDKLKVIGLMTMATQTEDQTEIRRCFAQLRQLRDQAQEAGFTNIQRLSMGMSSDFELAIAEGATDIRVGSALFGER